MANPQFQKCFRSALVYRPFPTKPDCVTVGFVLFKDAGQEKRVEVCFAPDLTPVSCLAPHVDLSILQDTLQELEPEIRSILGNVVDAASFPHLLPEHFPLELDVLPALPILTTDFEVEVGTQSAELFQSLDLSELNP
jgi:hypothetical protein